MSEYAYEGPKRSSNAVTWSFATQTYSADAGAPFSAPIAAAYQATIQAAFDRWSSVSGLSFTQVADSPNAGIRIGFGIFSSFYEIGETIIRSSGGFLPNDTVIRLLDPSVDPLSQDSLGNWNYPDIGVTLLQVATHEIGHALGLAHDTDPTTIMYPIATSENQALAAGDIEGINGLYPLYTVAAPDATQAPGSGGATYHFVITRYNDPAIAATINYQVGGTAAPGLDGYAAASASEFVGGSLPSGQINFAPGVSSVTLAVAVAGGAALQPDQGFSIALSSTSPATTATIRGVTSAEILGDGAVAAIGPGELAIYRFFDTADGTHFFTADSAERNAVVQTRPDLVYEGAVLTAISNPANDQSATAVYRFFDTVHGTHFYTSSQVERDTVVNSRADLVYEGIGFYEHKSQLAGDNAVYRFFDTQSGTHFFTATVAERASIDATRPNFIDEGVAFYAPAPT